MVCKQLNTGNCPHSKDECLNHHKRRLSAEVLAVDRCCKRHLALSNHACRGRGRRGKNLYEVCECRPKNGVIHDTGEPPKRRQPPIPISIKNQELREQFKVQGLFALPRECEGGVSPHINPPPHSPLPPACQIIFLLSSLIIHHSPEFRPQRHDLEGFQRERKRVSAQGDCRPVFPFQ